MAVEKPGAAHQEKLCNGTLFYYNIPGSYVSDLDQQCPTFWPVASHQNPHSFSPKSV